MTKPRRREKQPRAISSVGVLLLEVAVYAVLVTGYLIVVLRALRPFLLSTFEHRRAVYAALAVLLMLGQGLLLEAVTSFLVSFFVRARRDEGLSTPGFEKK